MNLIACVNDDWALGYKNRLLYSIPEDMEYFKAKTLNKVVVMGRKTYQSLRVKPLPHRYNVVLSSSLEASGEGLLVCSSIQQVYDAVANLPKDGIFIIGGADVYGAFIDSCSTAYVTKVYDSRSADTFFPLNLDTSNAWRLVETSPTYEHEGLTYSFNVYKNTKNPC